MSIPELEAHVQKHRAIEAEVAPALEAIRVAVENGSITSKLEIATRTAEAYLEVARRRPDLGPLELC